MKKGLAVLGGCLIAMVPIIVLAGTIYTLMLPNLYCSTVRIAIAEDERKINPFSDQEQPPIYTLDFLKAQYEVVQSNPTILYEVINRANLQQEWGRNGEELPRKDALKILRKSIRVFPGRNIDLMYIQVTRDNPAEAAEIANEIAEVYRESRNYIPAEKLPTSLRKSEIFLEDQSKRLKAAEKKVQRIREELDISELNGEGFGDGIDGIRLQQLEGGRLFAQKEMLEKEAILNVFPETLEELGNRTRDAFTKYIVFDKIFISTIQKTQDIEVQLSTLDETYDVNHPEVKRCILQKQKLEEVLDERLEVLRKGLQTEYVVAKNNFESLDAALAEIRSATIEFQGEKYRPYRNALNDLETERFIYEQLKEKHREEVATLEVPRDPVKIIDSAVPNCHPIGPNRFRNILVSVIIAGMFGLAGAKLLMVGRNLEL